jgi:hypothetical protein
MDHTNREFKECMEDLNLHGRHDLLELEKDSEKCRSLSNLFNGDKRLSIH